MIHWKSHFYTFKNRCMVYEWTFPCVCRHVCLCSHVWEPEEEPGPLLCHSLPHVLHIGSLTEPGDPWMSVVTRSKDLATGTLFMPWGFSVGLPPGLMQHCNPTNLVWAPSKATGHSLASNVSLLAVKMSPDSPYQVELEFVNSFNCHGSMFIITCFLSQTHPTVFMCMVCFMAAAILFVSAPRLPHMTDWLRLKQPLLFQFASCHMFGHTDEKGNQ